MRYHKHLFLAAGQCLASIFFEDRYADKAIEYYFRHNKKWGKRDRQFFAECIYDCTRWWRLYWHLIDQSPNPNSILQILAVSLWHRQKPLPDFPEVAGLNGERLQKRLDGVVDPAISQSVPDWLYQKGHTSLGDKWQGVLAGLNQQNKTILRPNELLTSRPELIASLNAEGFLCKPLINSKTAVELVERANIFRSVAFKEGLFEVQDGSSQEVAPFLDLEPGQLVIDACAGAGGKTLHLATLLKNKGRVIAMDIHQWKLDELKLRARRAKLSNIEIKPIENSKAIKRQAGKADRLLLDVPCSGLGVLRRNPDSKWKLSPERIAELVELQRDLLTRYSKMVKPGGRMVYATCSILPEENEKQVQWFLAENPKWSLGKQKWFYPVMDGFDGFYMAQLLSS